MASKAAAKRGKVRDHGQGALYYVASRKLYKAVIDVEPWPDGRRRQRTVTSRTKGGAQAKMDAIRDEIKEFGAPLDKSSTVTDWANHWLETACKPNLKPNALRAYESVTRRWIVTTIGNKRVALVKPSDIRSVQKAIADAGLSSSTARKAYNIMSGMFEAARRDGLAGRNVTKDVDAPAMAISNRGSLTTEQAFAVLKTAAEDVDGTRWWASILLGLRQSERLGAQLSSLDLRTGTLAIEWQLDEITSEHGCGPAVAGVWPCGKKRGAACTEARLKVPDGFEYRRLIGRLCLIRPKSGKTRFLPLIPQLTEALERYVEATKNAPNPHGLIWRHADGSPFLPGEDEAAWRNILERAGVITAEENRTGADIPTSHWARHTTATVLMELGVDPKIVGEIVGHQSEKTTRGYQHVSSIAARAAMDKLGEHFKDGLVQITA